MKLTLRKIGNRTVLVFPESVLRKLGLSAGRILTVRQIEHGRLALERRPRYTLAELIAQCDLTAPPPKDLALWDSAKPVGNEVM